MIVSKFPKSITKCFKFFLLYLSIYREDHVIPLKVPKGCPVDDSYTVLIVSHLIKNILFFLLIYLYILNDYRPSPKGAGVEGGVIPILRSQLFQLLSTIYILHLFSAVSRIVVFPRRYLNNYTPSVVCVYKLSQIITQVFFFVLSSVIHSRSNVKRFL